MQMINIAIKEVRKAAKYYSTNKKVFKEKMQTISTKTCQKKKKINERERYQMNFDLIEDRKNEISFVSTIQR